MTRDRPPDDIVDNPELYRRIAIGDFTGQAERARKDGEFFDWFAEQVRLRSPLGDACVIAMMPHGTVEEMLDSLQEMLDQGDLGNRQKMMQALGRELFESSRFAKTPETAAEMMQLQAPALWVEVYGGRRLDEDFMREAVELARQQAEWQATRPRQWSEPGDPA